MAPSGGRMDEIIRAVRDCPSGALSYAVDGVEARARRRLPRPREPAIEVSKDGPYRVTGGIALTDADGQSDAAQRGRVPRALRAVPLRALAEQAVLQRHALVRRVPRPGAGPGARADASSSGPAACRR